MTDRASWNDRPVSFVEFGMLAGDEVIDAYAKSARHGGRMIVLHSMRYTDTGTPVFASIGELEALPFRHFERITYLAARGAFVNGFGTDPDAVPDPAVQPNGHAAAAAVPSS
jgi:hypothetical protein